MKQFIYLNTDIVNSILAQKDKGLVLETASEHEDTNGNMLTDTEYSTLNSTVGANIWKFAKAQAEFGYKDEATTSIHSQTVLKEIETKTLHDAAFDFAYEHIRNDKVSNLTSNQIGSFIELNQNFEFVDLVYVERLIKGSEFINYIKKSDKKKIESQADEEFNKLNREERRAKEVEYKKQLKKAIEENSKSYDETVETVSMIRQLIPYNRLLVSADGYIIPLEDKYFRDNPESICFKHGGCLVCVGYITNIINEISLESQNAFSQIQTSVNQMLISLLSPNNQKLIVVNPIAIYYGK